MSKKSRTTRSRERAGVDRSPPPVARPVVRERPAAAPVPPTPEPVVRTPTAWIALVTIAGVLAVATFVAYLPALGNGFLNWDDPAYVTGNPDIRTLSWHTVRWAFTTFQEGIWHPLTWLSLAVDHRIYGGLQARGFHLTNVLLHVGNTVLVFLVWERLTGALWRSAIVAALFGLHPMHVESVAWVTERKDVLSTFFWLLTMGAYARHARLRTVRTQALVAFTFLLGLLSKPMLVTLPFVLLLLDYWPLRGLSLQAVSEKAPLLVLVAIVIGISVAAVGDVGASAVPDPIPLGALVANAIVSCVKYLKLTVWPVHLSPWYSHPWFEGAPLSVFAVGGAALALLAVSALVVAVARRFPYAPVGWFWYLGALVPMLGLVYNGRQGMADRYAYVPHIGLFVLVTWAVADLPVWRSRAARALGGLALGLLLVVLGVLTARQTRIWHDDRAFWTHTVTANPDSFIAHQALAILMRDDGRTDASIALFRRATRIRPELARVHVQMARVLIAAGRPGPAAAEYRKALAVEPNSADYRYGLGQVLLAERRPASARRAFQRALALRPNFQQARQGLAAAESQLERDAGKP